MKLSWCESLVQRFSGSVSLFFLCKMWLKMLMGMTMLLVMAVYLKTSFLAVLLCLEALVILGVLVMVHHSELMFSVCLISIGACESAIGLACLVGLVRSQGHSMLSF